MYGSAEATPPSANATLHAASEIFDTAALHSDTTNTQNFVAPVAGTYYVSAIVDWEANQLGYRRISIVSSNGAFASVAGPALPSPAFTSQTASGIVRLNAGDTVHVEVLQGSGGTLNATLNRFEIAFIGK